MNEDVWVKWVFGGISPLDWNKDLFLNRRKSVRMAYQFRSEGSEAE